MKRTFKLIIEIDGDMMTAGVESDPFNPAELGVVFGKMAQVAESMKADFLRLDPEHAPLFMKAFEEARTRIPPDGSRHGYQQTPDKGGRL